MKANNLKGEYCQNCASILDDVQRNHRRVVVLDSQCAAVYQQSGDAERLNTPDLPAPELSSAEDKHVATNVDTTPEKAEPPKPKAKAKARK